MSKGFGAGVDFLNLVDAVPEIDIDSSEGKPFASCFGHIKFDNVHYRYATRPHVPVLRGLK